MGEDPAGLVVGPRLPRARQVVDDPLVRRRPHRQRPDAGVEVVVVHRPLLVDLLGEAASRASRARRRGTRRGWWRCSRSCGSCDPSGTSSQPGDRVALGPARHGVARAASGRAGAGGRSRSGRGRRTLPSTKLSGGSQSASTSRSPQAPRRSRSRIAASQRGATSSCRADQAGHVVRPGGRVLGSLDRGEPHLLGAHQVVQHVARASRRPGRRAAVRARAAGPSPSSASSTPLAASSRSRVSSRSCSTSSSVTTPPAGAAGCSTHSEVGGWKWIPLGAGSQWVPGSAGTVLGGWPNARAKARLNPSTDS